MDNLIKKTIDLFCLEIVSDWENTSYH